MLTLISGASPAWTQVFSSGSDGSDGAYNPTGTAGTVILFDPTQFHGTQVGANIFNFTTITIPAGVTVKLSGNVIDRPVYWLAQGEVDIEGIVDLSGANGSYSPSSFNRNPAVPGSGGYAGGVGGNSIQAPSPGSGPGGGKAAVCGSAGSTVSGSTGGTFSGNTFLIPLIGGSGGGGGCDPTLFINGGAGGGSLLVASSTLIDVNGTITAKGGDWSVPGQVGSAGSGGAIRLIATTITGGGSLLAPGGAGNQSYFGGPGVVRTEAYSDTFIGTIQGTSELSTPFPLLLPTAGPPSAKVISIAGTSITPNPSTFPDITINTSSAVDVVIETQNIPVAATITLTIMDENNVPDTVIQAPPLSNCSSTNVCTSTVPVIFPFGASRGLTKVTWTQ